METSQPAFKCDETPTPTRFIRDCENLGLFQDLQNNPFEVTFRNAVQTSSHTSRSLPEPLSKAVDADTLDTPQVVPNSKRIEDYQHSYPIIEDEEDEIKLSNNYLIEYIFQEENDESNFAENQINDQLIQVIEQNGHRIDEQLDETVQDVRLNANYSSTETEKQSIEAEKDVIDLTLSPVDEQTSDFKTQSLHSRAVKEIFFDNEQSLTNKDITDEFLILHDNQKEITANDLAVAQTLKPAQVVTSLSVIANKNVLFIPSNHNFENIGVIKISPKPEKPHPPTIRDKLKTMLKPNQENIELKTEVRILNVHSPPVAPNDVKGYTRERNRIAQKRCRLKKKKWMSQLKRDTESVFDENKHLRTEIVSLRAEIANLKTLLLAHENCPVTQAMHQADVSGVVQKQPTPRRPSHNFPTTVPNGLRNGNGDVHVVNSSINQNKKLIMHSKRVHVSQLNRSFNSSVRQLLRNKTQTKPPLKIFIGSDANNSTAPVNSPNAVKIIHFNQNVTEVTDLTYDSS